MGAISGFIMSIFFLSLGSPVLYQTLCRRCVLKTNKFPLFKTNIRSSAVIPSSFRRALSAGFNYRACFCSVQRSWRAGLRVWTHLSSTCSLRVKNVSVGFSCEPRLCRPSNRPAQLIKSAVISAPPEMLYGTIKDALMIRYEYSAEWQLISRRRALSAASSMTILSPYDGTLAPLHPQIFLRCEGWGGG